MLDILGYLAFFLTTALTYGIICLGLNVQWGMTGLFNVGVAGFVAVGGYVSALLTTPDLAGRLGGFDMPILVGWAGGAAAAALCSALVGIVTLRLRADYLAITTFGIATAIQLVALNAQGLTGGPFGISFIPRPFGDWADRPLLFNGAHLVLTGAVLILILWGVERLARGPWGRVLRAIREDEAAAASLGKSPRRYRLQAFILGGAIMGLAGAVQAHFIGFIAPGNYLQALTFLVWTMLVVGGSGNNKGAILGALTIWGLWSASGYLLTRLLPSDFQARGAPLQVVVIGVVLALVLVIRPRGLLGEEVTVSRHLGSDPSKAM
jgi:branched-chain amino acid transport system permease protein